MNNWPLSLPVLGVLLACAPCAHAQDTNAPSTGAAPAATPPMAQPPVVEPSAGTTPDATPTAPMPAETTGPNPSTYTVVKGDTLWDLSHKFHTSIAKLKKLNNLKKNNLKPGQVLKIPARKTAAATSPKTTSVAHHAKLREVAASSGSHPLRRAEPVQDFDIPASTFASCPVPLPADGGTAEPAPAASVAPLEISPRADESATQPAPQALPGRELAGARPAMMGTPEYSFPTPAPTPAPAPTTLAKPADHGFFSFFYAPAPVSSDWGTRFTQTARDLGNRGLTYDEDWCPPGESHSWTMDCSNTTRYLYKVTTGIQLPRTASDQYYYLHLQNKAWDVPQTASGFADCNYLRQNLKPGDLLFWENTYRPERQPPITHVMVFLGTNARGNWLMAGSQTGRGGEHNRSHGGPDIYVFDPTKPCGGYTTWLGLVHHQGRFCAYGRPLEADKSKLAVAAND
jgi:LysM repeat protein